MNILFSVPRLHTNYAAMIQGLVEDGHHVSFIAMDGGTVVVPSDYNVPVYHIKAKKRWYMPKGRIKQLYNEKFTILNNTFKEQKPDLIIARDFQVINMQLSLLGKLRGIPTLYYDQIPSGEKRSLKRKFWYGIVHTFISRYRMTTVKKYYSDSNTEKNTFFIPFAVPYTPIKQEYPAEISADRPLKIIVVSKLGVERKNLLFLLDTLLPFFEKRVIRLSIYGVLRDHPNDRKNFTILTDFIETHELSEFVDLHKNKTHKKVLNAYSEYDLFILPSLDEPAAISPFEAMSSGLPVIVTEQNGTNYIIEDGKNGFIFDPKNKNDLQEKVSLFIEKSALIEHMGIEALNSIEGSYRPKHFSKFILNTIDSI
jgi:glycosyltransferase involved in cell wall biosynthesis